MSVDQELMEVFVSEARELIEKVVEILDHVNRSGEISKESVDELFRIFHTLKGNAAIIGLEKVSSLCHRLEDVLQSVREGKRILDRDCIAKLLAIANKLSDVVSEIENRGDIDPILKEIENLVNSLDNGSIREEGRANQSTPVEIRLSDEEKVKLGNAVARGLHIYRLDMRFSVDPALMVFRYFQSIHRLSEIGEIIKAIPENLENVKSNEMSVVIAVKKLEDLEEALKNLQDLESYSYTKLKPEDLGIDVEKMVSEASDTLSQESVISELERLVKRVEELSETSASTSSTQQQASEQKLEEIKVSVKSLDELFNLVGELVLIKSRLNSIAQQHDSPQLKEVLTTFSRLVNELQDQVMRLRLVPLYQLFRSLPAYVKDLAMKYSKDVDLYYEGGEIALDRKVLERIVEPLKKLLEIIVRDSIEVSDLRIKKGKPSIGSIKISATREGNQVIIVVEEDGVGLDPEEVKYRAIELGLVNPTVADKLSREEVFLLATLPGFSLRDGRFSGLDSVRKAIESLGGAFEIYSHVDTETRYTIKIPVSMATLRALLIKLNDDVYAVPISNIVTIVSVDSLDTVASKNLLRFQDKLIPIYDLATLLGIDSSKDKRRYAIVVEKRSKYSAVLVDEALGQEDIVVKALGKTLRNVKGIAGATILGDGRVCLILDISSLIP